MGLNKENFFNEFDSIVKKMIDKILEDKEEYVMRSPGKNEEKNKFSENSSEEFLDRAELNIDVSRNYYNKNDINL